MVSWFAEHQFLWIPLFSPSMDKIFIRWLYWFFAQTLKHTQNCNIITLLNQRKLFPPKTQWNHGVASYLWQRSLWCSTEIASVFIDPTVCCYIRQSCAFWGTFKRSKVYPCTSVPQVPSVCQKDLWHAARTK